jgi:serine/threonine protein kinase
LKKSITKGFCVKIADFGLIAIHKYSEQSHTMDKGTPEYTAPEVRDSKKYDTKADIYSLGIIFKKLLDFETNK